MIKRSLDLLPVVPLNHDSGTKRVLFNWQDFDTPCRQISIANFHAGDVCEEHQHATLDEHFYWQSGRGHFIIDGLDSCSGFFQFVHTLLTGCYY